MTYIYENEAPEAAPALPAAAEYEAGAEVTVAATPEADGYTFSGWATADAGIEDGKFTMPEKDVVLKGSWTKNAPVEPPAPPAAEKYSVTYIYEGEAPEAAPALPAAAEYEAGAEVTVAAAPEAEGYTFSGWATADAGMEDGKFTMPEKDVVLKGSWTKDAPVEPPVDPENPVDPVNPPVGPVNPPVNPPRYPSVPAVTPVIPVTPTEPIIVPVDFDDAVILPTEIEDEDVPMAELPQEIAPAASAEETEIAEEEVPLAELPLAEVPKTGDALWMNLLLTASSGAGLAWLLRKKREED